MKHFLFIAALFGLFVVDIFAAEEKLHKIKARRSALNVTNLLRGEGLPKSLWRELPGQGRFMQGKGEGEKVAEGQQELEDFHGLIMYGDVKIGSPAQTLQLGFTFHRNQMWVYGENSKPPTNRVKYEVKKYKESNSGSYKPGDLDFSLPFRLARGKYATDVVEVANQAIELQFGVCQSASFLFGLLPIDGEFGLGPNPMDNQGIQSPMNKVLNSVEKQLISIWVDRQSLLSTGEAAITLGGLDKEHCNKDWGFVDMTDTSGWHFSMRSVTVGKKTVELGLEKVRISDENHVIVGPRSQVKEILKPIGAIESRLGTWLIDCDKLDTAPDLSFNLGAGGKVKVVIPPEGYIVQVPRVPKCVVAIMSYPDPIKSLGWVVGETFYDGRCIALDWKKEQIGFATARL